MRFAMWQQTRQPSPGAMSYAFNYGFFLPPAASRGMMYFRGFYPTSLAPQIAAAPGVTLQGYGGLTFPGIASQPLIDPNAPTTQG